MNERLTVAERRALLAGDDSGGSDERDHDARLVADVLAEPSTWSEPDATLEDRVVRAVADAEPAPAPRRPAPVAAGRRSRGRRAVYAAAAVAASVAVVVGAAVATSGGGSGTDFSARLTATDLAPAARAEVAVTHNSAGFRIALDAHGLRRLHDGTYYQAWLKNRHGRLVAIGTFSSSDGEIVLWSGVSPTEYRAVTVTIEPDDDDPGSSGRRVLGGTLRAT